MALSCNFTRFSQRNKKFLWRAQTLLHPKLKLFTTSSLNEKATGGEVCHFMVEFSGVLSRLTSLFVYLMEQLSRRAGLHHRLTPLCASYRHCESWQYKLLMNSAPSFMLVDVDVYLHKGKEDFSLTIILNDALLFCVRAFKPACEI